MSQDQPKVERQLLHTEHVRNPKFLEHITILRQAIHDFRASNREPHTDETPLTCSYTAGTQLVCVSSPRIGHITVQVETLETDSKIAYVFDPGQAFMITINDYDDDGNVVGTYGLVPGPNNITTVNNVADYVMRASTQLEQATVRLASEESR